MKLAVTTKLATNDKVSFRKMHYITAVAHTGCNGQNEIIAIVKLFKL